MSITAVLQWLNNYANLLLAVITVAYVYLTWKTLKVLERSNLRERESQHLSDIKREVVAPLLQWLDFVIVKPLQGQGDPVIIMQTVGYAPSLQAPRQLYPPALPQMRDFSQDLYEHAMGEHFKNLREYQTFREMVEQLFGAISEFGNKCCAGIQGLTSIPRFVGDRSKNFIDCEGAVQFCLRMIIGANEPRFYEQAEQDGIVFLTTAYSADGIARGPENEIKQWVEKSKMLIDKLWNEAHLRERIQRTLADAEKLRDTIRQIELSYALPNVCKYVRD